MTDEKYKIAFGQRILVKENVLNDFLNLFQPNVWLTIITSLVLLTLITIN